VKGLLVTILDASCQLDLLLRLKQINFPDLLEVLVQHPLFARNLHMVLSGCG